MKVKKIAALAVGAAMVGATIGFASAQPTVPEIPKDFFVKDGQPNVKIVVGSQGAAMDVAGAADIAVAIGSLLYTKEDVKDAKVVVKKDVTEPVTGINPTDIPVFFNDRCTWGDSTKDYAFNSGEDIAASVKAWWNGAPIYQNWWAAYPEGEVESMPYLKFPGNMANLSTSVWNDSKITAGEIPFTIHGTSGQVNPLNFVMYDEGYVKLSDPLSKNYIDGNDVSFAEGNIIDYNVTIDYIQLLNLDKLKSGSTAKDPDTFKAIKMRIPAEGVHVKMDFSLESYYYPDSDCMCGNTGENVYYIDDYSKYGDPVADYLRPGLTTGDVLKLLGNKMMVVSVDTTLKDFGTYRVVFGEYHAPKYINAGESESFGDYTVKVVDIDVNSEKALLEISGPAGSKMVTLYTEAYAQEHDVDDYKVLFDGGIYVKLKNVFIGIGGTTSAEVEVSTNLKGINEGDEIIPGWIAKNIYTTSSGGSKYLKGMEITNKDKLEGTSFTLFNKFNVAYKTEISTKECENGDTFAVVKAWIDFDPITKTETKEQTLEVGDTIEGWKVNSIEGTSYMPGEVKTITVLDTEIMEKGLDKVDSNLILVGGPVVNSVTAALAEKLEVPSDYDGWKEEYGTGADSGVIKYIAECGTINGYGVVLVAGTDREGTQAAAEALMEYLAGLH